MEKSNYTVDASKLQANFDKITAISATEVGCTRFSYSAEDHQVRDYLKTEFFNLGLSVKTDFVGNLRAAYNPEGLTTPPILMGSHIDTVRMGGKYDGLAGVLTALEVIRAVKQAQIPLQHPLELMVFAEEEGSNFRVGLMGSKFLTGHLGIDDLKQWYDASGHSAYDLAKQAYFAPESASIGFLPGEVKAFIELHIEQGGILDSKGVTIGIVENIAGMTPLKITVTGQPNHAGSTPMYLRKNPMLAAAEIIHRIGDLPEKMGFPSAVLTVGRVVVTPNAFNVIPASVEFNVDLRDGRMDNLQVLKEGIKGILADVQSRVNTEIRYEELSSAEPVHMSDAITGIIEASAAALGASHMRINSGALHDTVMLSGLTDLGMIFVPSINGISHSPEEATAFEDIVTGANVLLETVLRLNGQGQRAEG